MKLWLVSLAMLVSAIASASPMTQKARQLLDAKDDLGLRILIRQNFKQTLSIEDWNEINKILSERPNVGFDVTIAWYRQKSILSILNLPQNQKIQKELEAADNLSLEGKFADSFKKYQNAAQMIRQADNNKVKKMHLQLYFNVLHQMARQLYSMKKFEESLEVYDWISPTYYQFRQVLFEKMWAGFRAHKMDRALGAIASQQSAFYSEYLEPESYLLKVYILKKLCRNSELKETIQSIKIYLKRIKENKYTAIDWAKNDLLRISLANLLTQGLVEDKFDIGKAERSKEKKFIFNYLQSKFSSDKNRIILTLEKALGYATLATSTEQKVLSKISDLPPSSELEKKGYEYWPGSVEEWVDEIGSRVYIGESQCRKTGS